MSVWCSCPVIRSLLKNEYKGAEEGQGERCLELHFIIKL